MKRYLYIAGPLFSTATVIYFLFTVASERLTYPSYVLFIASIALVYIFVGVYAMHIWKNDQLKKEAKALWLILILFTSVLSQVVYWKLHIKNSG
jgi:hypothetical protein